VNDNCAFYAFGFCDGCEPGECDEEEEDEYHYDILTTLDGDDIPE
jgi:hypothetical protein